MILVQYHQNSRAIYFILHHTLGSISNDSKTFYLYVFHVMQSVINFIHRHKFPFFLLHTIHSRNIKNSLKYG